MDTGFIILAGGKSQRLGRNKAAEILGGRPLLERVILTLASFQNEIILVKAADSRLWDNFSYPRLKIVNDIYPGKGISGGIYTGLSLSGHFYNLVVGCDMPFLNRDLLEYMLSIAKGFDLVAYREGDWFEPLHAVYSTNCLTPLKEIIESNLRIIELTGRVKVRYLAAAEIEKFDPHHRSFFNINTPDDLEKARELLGEI